MSLISIRQPDGTIERIMLHPDDRDVEQILKSHHEILEKYLEQASRYLPVNLWEDFSSALFDLGYFIDEHVPEGIDPLP